MSRLSDVNAATGATAGLCASMFKTGDTTHKLDRRTPANRRRQQCSSAKHPTKPSQQINKPNKLMQRQTTSENDALRYRDGRCCPRRPTCMHARYKAPAINVRTHRYGVARQRTAMCRVELADVRSSSPAARAIRVVPNNRGYLNRKQDESGNKS